MGWKDWSCPKLLTIDEQNERHQSGFQEDSWPPPLDNGASIFVGGCHRLFYAIYRAITAWKTQRLSPFLIFMTKSNPSLLLSHCSLGLTSSWVVISISFCHQGNHCLHFENLSTHISSFAFVLWNVFFHLPSRHKRVLRVPHGLYFQGSANQPLENAISLPAPTREVSKLYENDLTLSWPAEILRGLITRRHKNCPRVPEPVANLPPDLAFDINHFQLFQRKM